MAVEGSLHVAGLRGVVAGELGNLRAVGRVLVDAGLEVLRGGLVEGLLRLLVLRVLVEELEGLLHEVILDHAQDLVLLERLERIVEWKILGSDGALSHLGMMSSQLSTAPPWQPRCA